MESKIYGFLIEDDILFDIDKKRLVRFTDEPLLQSMTIRVVSLNGTLVRLLVLLLLNGKDAVISKDDILKSVWDGHKLSSSSQRLWHTINDLRKKLSAIGLPNEFILNVHGTGYAINSRSITPLFRG